MYLKQYKAKKLFGAIGTIIDGSIAYVDLNGFDDFRNLSLWGLKMKVIEIKDRNPILVPVSYTHLSPIINSRCPRPIGNIASIARIPVSSGTLDVYKRQS